MGGVKAFRHSIASRLRRWALQPALRLLTLSAAWHWLCWRLGARARIGVQDVLTRPIPDMPYAWRSLERSWIPAPSDPSSGFVRVDTTWMWVPLSAWVAVGGEDWSVEHPALPKWMFAHVGNTSESTQPIDHVCHRTQSAQRLLLRILRGMSPRLHDSWEAVSSQWRGRLPAVMRRIAQKDTQMLLQRAAAKRPGMRPAFHPDDPSILEQWLIRETLSMCLPAGVLGQLRLHAPRLRSEEGGCLEERRLLNALDGVDRSGMPSIPVQALYALCSSDGARLLQWFSRMPVTLAPFGLRLAESSTWPAAVRSGAPDVQVAQAALEDAGETPAAAPVLLAALRAPYRMLAGILLPERGNWFFEGLSISRLAALLIDAPASEPALYREILFSSDWAVMRRAWWAMCVSDLNFWRGRRRGIRHLAPVRGWELRNAIFAMESKPLHADHQNVPVVLFLDLAQSSCHALMRTLDVLMAQPFGTDEAASVRWLGLLGAPCAQDGRGGSWMRFLRVIARWRDLQDEWRSALSASLKLDEQDAAEEWPSLDRERLQSEWRAAAPEGATIRELTTRRALFVEGIEHQNCARLLAMSCIAEYQPRRMFSVDWPDGSHSTLDMQRPDQGRGGPDVQAVGARQPSGQRRQGGGGPRLDQGAESTA